VIGSKVSSAEEVCIQLGPCTDQGTLLEEAAHPHTFPTVAIPNTKRHHLVPASMLETKPLN